MSESKAPESLVKRASRLIDQSDSTPRSQLAEDSYHVAVGFLDQSRVERVIGEITISVLVDAFRNSEGLAERSAVKHAVESVRDKLIAKLCR
jgi:hypothetical protein